MNTQQLIIDVPDNEWLTSNSKEHPQAVGRKRRALRRRSWAAAKQAKLMAYRGPVHIMALITYRTTGRADPTNAIDTCKPIIDGLVDAGVLVDDDSSHVLGPDMRRDKGRSPKGWHRVRLVMTDQFVPF